jgi:hypothetical protein
MSRKLRDKKKNKKSKKIKKIFGTASEKSIKRLNKVLDNLTDIPELEEVRQDCNHHNHKGKIKTYTVKEVKELGQAYLIPELDAMINVFGSENIDVCSQCLTPLVKDIELVDVEVFANAMATISAVSAAITVNMKKQKQVNAVNKIARDTLKGMRFIEKRYKKYAGKNKKEDASVVVNKKADIRKEL